MGQDEKEIKVIYEFYLPVHQKELNTFQNAQEYHSILLDIDQECRSVIKYESDKFKDIEEFAEFIRSLIEVELYE